MREVALVASDGQRMARTPVTLRQSASVSPMTTLAVRLDPSVVRLSNRRRGSSAVVVDNGQGRAPIRVWLRGDDPENVLAFTFTPAEVDIPAGQSVTSRMTFSGPRAPSGREITRSFTVAATDGRSAATNTGSIIQSAGDRRPWARVLLTIGGAVAILLGVMLPFADRVVTAVGLDDDAVEQALAERGLNVELGDLPGLVSVGLVLMVLAGLMAFGLTGASGRLTRWMALPGSAGAGRGRRPLQPFRPRSRRDGDRAGLHPRLHRRAAASSLIPHGAGRQREGDRSGRGVRLGPHREVHGAGDETARVGVMVQCVRPLDHGLVGHGLTIGRSTTSVNRPPPLTSSIVPVASSR